MKLTVKAECPVCMSEVECDYVLWTLNKHGDIDFEELKKGKFECEKCGITSMATEVFTKMMLYGESST